MLLFLSARGIKIWALGCYGRWNVIRVIDVVGALLLLMRT